MEEYVFITEETQNKDTLCKARRPLSALSCFQQYALYITGIAFIICGIIYLLRWQIISVGLVALALGIFLFFSSSIKRHRQYRMLKQYQNAEEWQQRICFGDRIQLTSGRQSLSFEYAQFGKLTETKDAFYLWMEKSSAIRIPKDAFVTGDCAAFPAFVQPKLGVLKTGTTDRNRIIVSAIYLAISLLLLIYALWL